MKKKEAVIITHARNSQFREYYHFLKKSMFPDGMMLLDRLARKEMITKTDQKESYSNGSTFATSGTWTFAKD